MLEVKNNGFEFSAADLQKVEEIKRRYPAGRQKSALLPLLHMAQAQQGWLSVPAMDYIAGLLELKPIEVYEVATFYSMFHLQPVGKYVLEVCRTGPCALVGAERIIGYLEKKLGIRVGQTTADNMFTLKTVECLASCGSGPVLQIGPEYVYHENLTEAKIDSLIEELRSKKQ